jgi:hypothetical protein
LAGVMHRGDAEDAEENLNGFLKSKTVWFNLLAGGLAAGNAIGFADFSADPDLIALIMAIVNILLRFLTKKPLGEK